MATITKITAQIPKIKAKLRVAAYARVSVNAEGPHHSLSAQVSYYNSLIQSNPEWEYAGVYADEGISGTSTRNRDEFNRLIADCEKGKIDMVLVKSISRFARDTVDTLKTVRRLKQLGIAVYFEREKINSLSSDGELLLTFLSSYAQEESRSISENVKWRVRKKFEQGIPNTHNAAFGYRWDGEMYRIIPEQGKVVKEIYKRYLSGEPAYSIAKDLASRDVCGQQQGRPIEQTTVKDILSNISYTGTMMLQKYFITENHVRKTNKGELPIYLVDEMYEPLVTEEEFEKAKMIRQQRAKSQPNRNPQLTVFSGKMKCGICGCGVSRRTSKARKFWMCNTRERKGEKVCDCLAIWEKELIQAATQVMGKTEFDEQGFEQEIQKVVVYRERLKFIFKNGSVREYIRQFTGERGRNAFKSKVWCGLCGSKCERDNRKSCGKIIKIWHCSKKKSECQLAYLKESELIEAAKALMGETYQPIVVRDLDKVWMFNDRLEFALRDGMVKTWQRK